MKAWGIVAAAGSGARLGAQDLPKALLPIGDEPMLHYGLRSLFSIHHVAVLEGVAAVVPSGWEGIARDIWQPRRDQRYEVVAGGESRQASVRAALGVIPEDVDAVIVHDAARPFAEARLFEDVLRSVYGGADAAVAGVPMVDTVKRMEDGTVLETIDRDGLWTVQTPQAFRAAVLREAHRRALEDGVEGTDDAALVERIGGHVVAVMGAAGNVKITTQGDLLRARRAFPSVPAERFGTGFDVHELVAGRPLVIGGIEIAFERGLQGHSDADVLLHAIGDAVLGAAGLGDLGAHFPSSDARWKGVSSLDLLRCIDDMLKDREWGVHNVDATIIIEAPSMAPHREAMRAAIASALDIPEARVNIKATTTDGLGILGEGKGAAAQAIATVGPRLDPGPGWVPRPSGE